VGCKVAGGGALGGGVLDHRSARSGRSVYRCSCYGPVGHGVGRMAVSRWRRRPRACASDPGQAGLGLGLLCGPDGPELYGSCARHARLLLLITSSCSYTCGLVLNLSGLIWRRPWGFLAKILRVCVLEEREKSLLACPAPTRRRLWVSSFLLGGRRGFPLSIPRRVPGETLGPACWPGQQRRHDVASLLEGAALVLGDLWQEVWW
jgi:hypothetical protein